jgi:hypothetical protein
MRNAYKVLDRKPERSRPLGRPKCGWKDAIKIDFKEIIWKVLYWVCLPRIQSHDEHVWSQ